jgi:hypothetical protein
MIEWRTIPSFPNYEASNTGFVRRAKNKRQLKSKNIDIRPYQIISIWYNKKKYTKTVARLVYEAFHGCPCEMTIDHIDRVKTNNHISNLRCISIAENHKNRSIYRNTNKYNLNDEIKTLIISNYRNKVWTTWDISKKYGIPSNYISSVIKRGSWDKLWKNSIKDTNK